MRKLLFLAAIAVSVISCERDDDNVTKNETSLKQPIKVHEKNSSKTASDTLSVSNISSGTAGQESIEPSDDVNPGDIKTPPRTPRSSFKEEESEDVNPDDIKTPPRK